MFKVWDKVLYEYNTTNAWDICPWNEYYITVIDSDWRLALWNNMNETHGWRWVREWDIKLIERKKEAEDKYNIVIKI